MAYQEILRSSTKDSCTIYVATIFIIILGGEICENYRI